MVTEMAQAVDERPLPETVKIGGVDYIVEYVPDLRDGDQGLNGWIRYNDCKIQIDADLSDQRKRIVLWHEIVHGLLENAGAESEHDEKIVVALGYGLVQVLRDNPQL